MSSRRAICVSRDAGLRRTIERVLGTVGMIVEDAERVPAHTGDAALVVVDREARIAAGAALSTLAAPVVIVGDDLEDDSVIAAMLEAPVSHLVRDLHAGDLEIMSEKLASGDLFGLEKYLARGAPVGQRTIGNDADKRHAIDEVCAWAETIGERRRTVHRLATVTDELMMNALGALPASPGVQGGHVALRWGSDRRAIAISVSDSCGALRQRDVVDQVRRARSERGRPRRELGPRRGAGIGLYLVLANVASLVINVEVGRRTEVVCLFDRATPERPAASFVRSFHVFRTAAP
jgi:hypothetical protein